jgi:hypothetical protein
MECMDINSEFPYRTNLAELLSFIGGFD